MRGGGRPDRESDALVGATLPAKKGQVFNGRFYLGKRRAPAVICSHLSHGNRRRFHLTQKRPLPLVGSGLRPYE